MGEEPGWVDGRIGNIPFRDQVTNLGTDIVAGSIGRGVVDFTDRLDRDMAISADRLGEGCSVKIRPVNECWVVAIPGDAVVVSHPLVFIGGTLGHRHSGGIASKGEGRKIGRCRRPQA